MCKKELTSNICKYTQVVLKDFVSQFANTTNKVKEEMSKHITDKNDYGWFKVGVESVMNNLQKWLETNLNFYKNADERQDEQAK